MGESKNKGAFFVKGADLKNSGENKNKGSF